MSEEKPPYEVGQVAEREQQQALAASGDPKWLQAMLQTAVDKGDVSIIERIGAMQERASAKFAETMFNNAMTAAQVEIRPVKTDEDNSQTHSRYATYSALDKALRPIYTKHGFALSFNTEPGAPDQHIRVTCIVSHTAGHSRKYAVDMPADGKGAKGGDVMTKTHAAGSALSYGMRYLLKLIFNVVTQDQDDDDGNAAGIKAINAEQVKTLTKMCEEANKLDPNAGVRWLKYLRVPSITGIAEQAYDHAYRALEKLMTASKPTGKPEAATTDAGNIVKTLTPLLTKAKIDATEFCAAFGIEKIEALPLEKLVAATKWIKDNSSPGDSK